jgi:2-methylcitrate dehydratase
MGFTRDLAWKYLESQYQASISYHLSRYALDLTYEKLPSDVVHQAKRCLLDALGCAIGAFDAPGRPMCETLVKQLGGVEEATLFGSGLRTNAANATIANSFLVRFLDANDLGGGGHNTDAISSILAVAEREKSSGRNCLASIVLSYELGARFIEAVGGDTALENNGWISDIRAGFSMPPALGRLMGLNEEQITNAIGICASHSFPLRILDTHREENTMCKNLRFGFIAHDAILSCILAKQGFTGPIRVMEGENGFRQVILKDKMDVERLVDFSGWRILNTRHKLLCLCGGILGYVVATIDIVKENDLKPEDIASVKIKASLHNLEHTTTLSKKYPRNAESADHSAFYSVAIAIKERTFGPDSFEPDKFVDPVVLDLIEKITAEVVPDMPEWGTQGMTEITTKDGRHFSRSIEKPHGIGDDPLTDKELEEKFKNFAEKYFSAQQIQKIFDTVWRLEKLDNLNALTASMIIPSK